MGWKDLPYWFKGGVIGLIIAIIVGIPFFLRISTPCEGQTCGIGTGITFLPFLPAVALPVMILGEKTFNSDNLPIFVIFAIFCYSAIGALIGWIVGKIKQRKTSASPPQLPLS